MKPFLAAVFLSVAVVLYMGWLTGAIPSEVAYCEPDGQTKPKDCPLHNIIFVSLWQTGEFLEKASETITAFASIAIAIFTWTLYRATNALWEAGERQIKIARDSSRASRDAVNEMRLATQTGMRAYVYLRNIEPQWRANKGEDGKEDVITHWVFTPVWNNSGQTPTINATTCVSCATVVGNTDAPVLLDFADQSESGKSYFPPQAIMHGHSQTISIEHLKLMYAREARAFAWGWAEYDDVFEGTRRHRHEFCFEIIVIGNAALKNGGFQFRRHGAFNGDDGQCYRDPQNKT